MESEILYLRTLRKHYSDGKRQRSPVMCCGQKMTEIIPGTSDASQEKHVPVYTIDGNLVKVKVGSAEHPMLPEHYIEWVSLQTKYGNQRKVLKPGGKPEACFAICDGDEIEAVYAYAARTSLESIKYFLIRQPRFY